MGRLGWDYMRKKPSYRQFCQDMSERFLRMPVDRRLRDTTAGSVRLALCHLRPWFHRLALEDFTTANVTVCELAFVIARWSGQWWVREHPEIQALIRCMVHIIGEEVREARKVQALADATRMQEIVGGLEQLAQTYQMRSRMRKLLPSTMPTPVEPKSVEQIPTPVAAPIVSPVATVKPETDLEKAASVDAEVSEVPPTTGKGPSIQSFVRSASTLLTGFFVGAFVTLWVLAPDTRQLARHLT